MPKLIYPSSYLCDCGFRCDFFENTIREITEVSRRRPKKQYLIADDNQHEVVFHKGEWIGIICPKENR